jgi:hypothetical protein
MPRGSGGRIIVEADDDRCVGDDDGIAAALGSPNRRNLAFVYMSAVKDRPEVATRTPRSTLLTRS